MYARKSFEFLILHVALALLTVDTLLIASDSAKSLTFSSYEWGWLKLLIKFYLYFLWSMGLKVGHCIFPPGINFRTFQLFFFFVNNYILPHWGRRAVGLSQNLTLNILLNAVWPEMNWNWKQSTKHHLSILHGSRKILH